MCSYPSPQDGRAVAVHAARDRLAVIHGRTSLLLRRLQRDREFPPGTLEAGLVEIDAAARALLPAIDELERGVDPTGTGPT